jgi:hypothetical protein
MSRERGSSAKARAEQVAELRERARLMLAAFEREEPSPRWAPFREAVERASRLGDLRTLVRECRAMTGAMSPAGRRELDQALRERFGADPEWDRDLTIVAKVRGRGQIRSEAEYRPVQAYQDSIAGDLERHNEFLALGALLDEFSAAP